MLLHLYDKLIFMLLDQIYQTHKFKYCIDLLVQETQRAGKEHNGEKMLGCRKEMFRREGERRGKRRERKEKKKRQQICVNGARKKGSREGKKMGKIEVRYILYK